MGSVEIGADRSDGGATKEGWRNEEGEAVVERVTYRLLCGRFLLCRCGSGPREVQAHSTRKLQETGRVEPVLFVSARCALVCLAFDSAAGVVDGRACGSGSTLVRLSYHPKGSFVLRWRRVPKRGFCLWQPGQTARAVTMQGGWQVAAISQGDSGCLGRGREELLVCGWQGVCVRVCRVVTSRFVVGNFSSALR